VNSVEDVYCKALPNIIKLSDFGGDFYSYEDYLYKDIFLKDLYNFKLTYNNKLIEFKTMPRFNNKEDSFYHLTCKIFEKGSNEREPDFRRSERLCWLKPAIETNHLAACQQSCFLVYERPYKSKKRICFLNKEDRYFIVLEERESYYLLITAYYLDYDNALEKKIKEYEKYKKS
jgi:hypothetical protein